MRNATRERVGPSAGRAGRQLRRKNGQPLGGIIKGERGIRYRANDVIIFAKRRKDSL